MHRVKPNLWLILFQSTVCGKRLNESKLEKVLHHHF